MNDDSFQTLLDRIDTDKTTVVDICKNYNKQNSSPIITDEQLNKHPFFTKYFSNQLCEILNYWFTDGILNENQKEIFQICSEFLLKLTKTHSNVKQWLNQQNQLINLTKKCLNEIASYGYYIEIGGSQDSSLESFDLLIQAFKNVQCQQLLDILVKCVTSRFYIEALYRLNDVDASSLSITQHFLLVTCTDYILTCDIDKKYSLKIVNQMLSQYYELFIEFLPHIKQWTIPIIVSLSYPMKFVLSSIRSLSFEQKTLIFQVILPILLNKPTSDPNIEQARIILIDTSLCLLIEIIRSDKDLLNQLKNKIIEKSILINILNDLSKIKNDKIQLKALELVSLLVPEEEFFKENNTKQVTGLFVKNFNEAFQDGKVEQVDEILSGLKDFVQNDEVKEEVIKQNALPSIIKYAKETKDNPIPLEVTYAMAFNNDAKKVINQDKDFIDHVKQLRKSENKDVSQAAHGIMWKLEGEEKFKKKEEDKEKEKQQNKSEENSNKESEKYDIMISYCWAQKTLCHKINDRLAQDGYHVWLDRDEMHGSIIESMAAAIEQSRFVLICMSSNYKNSSNCKAEAEYAYSRKSKIVPLIVEPHYKADGWLGFLAGSKIYINFADKEGDEFDQAYKLLIAELERNGLKDTNKVQQNKTTPRNTTGTKSKPEKSKEQPEAPRIQTREYLNIGPTSVWNNKHVNEFLIDNQLDQLIPICQSMDGEALTEFHYSCQTLPDKMYELVNNPREKQPVSFDTYFKFISRLKKYLPPKLPRIAYFQYSSIFHHQSQLQQQQQTKKSANRNKP